MSIIQDIMDSTSDLCIGFFVVMIFCIPFILMNSGGGAIAGLIIFGGFFGIIIAAWINDERSNKKTKKPKKSSNTYRMLERKICPGCGHEMGGPIKTESKSNKRKRIFHKKRTADDAWKTCPECGRRVYHAVKECPHCSYKF